jgi:tRNA threonylcarbamoyladenosine biosynthesis protein TsaE
MNKLVFDAPDVEATGRLGAALESVLPPGTTVALCGTLGAGKTYLVKAMAVAGGVDAKDVTSPTFVICREYHGRRTFYHLDAYRIRDDDEFLELGPEEYFESDGITLIEWADRVTACLPSNYVEVQIEPISANARRFSVRSVGKRYEPVIETLRERLRA